MRLALSLLTIELLLFAVVTPLLMARALRGRGGLPALIFAAGPLVALAAVSVAVCALATRGSGALAAACWAQLFLFSFAVLLGAVMVLLNRLGGCSPTVAQWIATCLALAMVANVFYVNAAIGVFASPSAKTAVARLALWTNPWLIVGGTILQADPLRTQRLYEWCIIGDYQFPVNYPAAGAGAVAARTLLISATYLAAAFLIALPAWLIARRLRPALNCQPKSD